MSKTALPSQTNGYNITITGRHMSVTEGMKQHALDKLSKLERVADRILDVHVTMDIQKIDHRIDIVIKFNHIKIKVHAITNDMYNSIDQAVNKLQNQIKRYKEKLYAHQAKSVSSIDMNVNVISSTTLDEVNDEIESYNNQELERRYEVHKVVSREVKPLKILSQDEAIMKMELSQDAFLIYIDEVDRKLKVIYRRKDGHFGIIETQR